MRLYYGKDKVCNDSSQKISASGLQDPVELKPNEPLLKGFLLFSKTVVFGKKKRGGGVTNLDKNHNHHKVGNHISLHLGQNNHQNLHQNLHLNLHQSHLQNQYEH